MDMSMVESMKNTDVRTVDKTALVDLKDIIINSEAPREQRVADYIRQIKNPYCFLCNGYTVKLEFSNNGRTIEDCFSEYIKTLM